MNRKKYTKWKFDWIFDRPTTGSKWHLGNFYFGFNINRHPRFQEYIVGLGFIEIGISWRREAIPPEGFPPEGFPPEGFRGI